MFALTLFLVFASAFTILDYVAVSEKLSSLLGSMFFGALASVTLRGLLESWAR